ncbi:MAG: hypothetical protein ACHQIM_22700 [Sphingobacteriales bacterium]
MNNHKKPERRTFLQDRFEILIKRQKTGEATFNELTELDDIVNSDPEIRDKIIRESMLMEGTDAFIEPLSEPGIPDLPRKSLKRETLSNRIKSLIARIFTSQFTIIKNGGLIIVT